MTVNPLAAALSFSGFLGYVFIYTVWLKRRTPSEHRHRRRRRGGATARRLGGGDRHGQRDGSVPLLHRLLLDAAALLGALAADEGRVQEGRGADDAGRPRRGRDPQADPAVFDPALRGHPAALLRRRLRRHLPRLLADPWASGSSPGRCACTGAPTAPRRCASTSTPWPTSRCCSARWSPTPIYRMRHCTC